MTAEDEYAQIRHNYRRARCVHIKIVYTLHFVLFRFWMSIGQWHSSYRVCNYKIIQYIYG